MRASQADKGLRTISGTQMSYNQKVPVFQVPFCHIDPIIVYYEYEKEIHYRSSYRVHGHGPFLGMF
jgi:hypothetical protein